MLAFAAAVLLLVQEDAGALVELLRSDSVVERDEAAKKLLALGAAARPALEKAARDPDAEVASRAGRILRVLEIRSRIPPRLKAAVPGIEERLATDVDRAWTEAFLLLISDRNKPIPPSVTTEDLGFLVARALRGADSEKHRLDIVHIAGAYNLRPAIPELVPLLRSPSHRLSHSAKQALLDLDAREAWPQLLELLGGSEKSASSYAQSVIRDLQVKEAAPGLIERLRAELPHVRANAAACLEVVGTPEHSVAVVPLLRDQSDGVCRAAARAVGTLGSREAVPALLALLLDGERDVQGAAAFALGKLGAKEAVPDLLRALEKPGKHDAREEISAALGELEAKNALPALLRLLEDKEFQGQAEVLPVAARLGGGAASPQIVGCFKHEDAEVRAAAVRAARSLKVKGLAPALAGLLEDSSDEVWQEAAEAIVETGAAEIAPQLQALAANETAREVSRRAALVVLGRGGVKAAVPFLRERLRDEKLPSALAVCAAYALGGLGAPESQEELRRLLGSKDDDVQAAAAMALGRLGAKEAAGELRDVLGAKSHAARCAAARALAALGDREAVPLLRKAAEGDEFPGVAALALAELGDRESLPSLFKLLESEDIDERRDAVDALARIDPRAAEARLRERLASPEGAVRKAAASGLCRLGSREGVAALLEAARNDARLSLFALNAVRTPATWKKLLDRKVASVLPGGTVGAARLIRLTAQIEIDTEDVGFTSWMFGSEIEQGWRSALHALEEYEDNAVLDGERGRVLPRHRALRFWQDWWRAEEKGK